MKKLILLTILFSIFPNAKGAEGSKTGNGGFALEEAARLLIRSRDRLIREILILQQSELNTAAERLDLVTVLNGLKNLKELPEKEEARDGKELIFDYDVDREEIYALKPYYYIFGATSVETAEIDELKVMRKLMHEAAHLIGANEKEAKELSDKVISKITGKAEPAAQSADRVKVKYPLEKFGWKYYLSYNKFTSRYMNGSYSQYHFNHIFMIRADSDEYGKDAYEVQYYIGRPNEIPQDYDLPGGDGNQSDIESSRLVRFKLREVQGALKGERKFQGTKVVEHKRTLGWANGVQKNYLCDIEAPVTLNTDLKGNILRITYQARDIYLPELLIQAKGSKNGIIYPGQLAICGYFKTQSKKAYYDGWVFSDRIVETDYDKLPWG
ncbi:MAG: hypothetical protein R3A80_08730 [Bdellovibrionota bacterium]